MAPPRPPDPPESSEARRPEELAFSALSNTLTNDQFLSLHGLQIQDFFFDPSDYDLDLTIDDDTFDPQVHFLPPALDPAPTTPSNLLTVPPAAPLHQFSQSDYNARLLQLRTGLPPPPLPPIPILTLSPNRMPPCSYHFHQNLSSRLLPSFRRIVTLTFRRILVPTPHLSLPLILTLVLSSSKRGQVLYVL